MIYANENIFADIQICCSKVDTFNLNLESQQLLVQVPVHNVLRKQQKSTLFRIVKLYTNFIYQTLNPSSPNVNVLR